MGAHAQSIKGDWKGEIEAAPGMKLELIFHITQEGDQLQATMDIPMQGATGIPMETVTCEENQVTLALSAIGMTYKGVLKDDAIEGTFSQQGMDLPLTLNRFESKLPGDPSLPSTEEELKALAALDKGDYKYTIEDYFARPKASSFQIAPNGKYMSYMEKDDANKTHVYVKEIATGKVNRAIEEKDELIRGYSWINNNRLVYVMDQGGNENYHIYAANIDGSNNIDLTPFEGVNAAIINPLREQEEFIIIQMNKNNKQIFEPYKLNVVTGEMEQLYTNDDPTNPIQNYIFDKDGVLHGYAKLVNGKEMQVFYRSSEAEEFENKMRVNWDNTFAIVGFDYSTPNPDDVFVASNLDSDKMRLLRYDMKANKEIEELFAHPEYDVSSIRTSKKRGYEIDTYGYEGVRSEVVPVSDFMKHLYKRIKEEFPGKDVFVADYDDDETTYLLVAQSDKHYGSYHIYDVKNDKFELLYDLMPQLKEEDMAEMRPISFKSRDGLTIHGYITLPKAALEGKKVPLIVNPHGGPQGIRDSWGFNPEAQLFASRGYATLQVNFRISGGYGKAFMKAGFKQIGRKAMDDVEDGVRYVIEQGWVDADKIGIYGGSHGGYATLMGLVKTPDLYACGVDYVGVSNIFTFFNSFPEYWKPLLEIMKEVWYNLDDPKEAQWAKEASPIFHIDKINKPLFVVQGANDPRVNINESDQIVTALRAKGFKVPYMVKYNEGHGFAREENRLDFYKAMMGFFAEHLKN